MKRAIVFDFGGVLMKTSDYAYRHQWDDRLGLPRGSVERVVHGSESWRLAQLGQVTLADYWQDVARQLDLSPDALAALQHDYFAGDMLDEALIAYIQQLRAAGHPVALLSNDSPALREKLQYLGIASLFDPLVISGDIGYMKPAPQAYQAVLDALQLPAHQAVFIDDMPANIAGAQAVGMHAIHYTPALDLQKVLETGWLNE
jgi:putative hydrolase of the HAD superfamily